MTKCSRCQEPMASDDMVELASPRGTRNEILVVHLECMEDGDTY